MHTFKNFKNFADAEIDLSKPMTLLIGRNGSGKSNVIDALELISELLQGRRIEHTLDIGLGDKTDFEIRGGASGCIKKNETECSISFKYSKENDEFSALINLKLNEKNGRWTKSVAKLFRNNVEIVSRKTSNKKYFIKILLIIASFITGIFEPVFFAIGLIILLYFFVKSWLEKFYKRLDKNIENEIKSYIFDFYPKSMRSWTVIGFIKNKINKQLAKDGSNLSSVLYHLNKEDPDALKRILKNIKELPEESIKGFSFRKFLIKEVIFYLQYENDLEIKASLLSDGTLRALAILTALETVPEGSRIIIEEIDNGVHASRVHVLIEAIWEASNRRHLNTLITTHNPATLDSLNDEQLECVVVCHYDKQSQSAKLTPFFELPRVYELMERGHLGSLVVKNIIEQHLEPDFEQKRRGSALAWLESLND